MKSLPKVIRFETDERSSNYKYLVPSDFQFPISLEIKSIVEDVDYFAKNGLTVVNGKYPQVGDIFFQDPFHEKKYIPADLLTDDYIRDSKISLYRDLAQRLGLKSCSVKVEEVKSESIECDFSGNISYKKIDVKADYKDKAENEIKKTLHVEDEFSIKKSFSLEKVISEIREEHKAGKLYLDDSMHQLLKFRDPKRGNLLTRRNLKTVVEQEFNKLKEIGATLNVLDIFRLSSTFKKQISQKSSTSVEIEFVFHDLDI